MNNTKTGMNNTKASNNVKQSSNTRTSASSGTSASSASAPRTYTSANMFGIIVLIIVIIAILYAIYWVYGYYTTINTSNPVEIEVMPDVKNASNSTTISSSTIPNSSYSNEYAISFWLNIQDYNYQYGTEKVIMRRGTAGSGNPEIVLDTKTNDLIVRVQLQGTNLLTKTTIPNVVPTTAPTTAPTVRTPTVPITTQIASFTDIPNDTVLPNVDVDAYHKLNPEEININANIVSPVNPDENITFTKLGNNEVDYPTVNTIIDSDDNGYGDIDGSRDGEYGYGRGFFDLISGNNINSGLSKTQKNSEGFDNTLTTGTSTKTICSLNANASFDTKYSDNPLIGTCVAKMIPLQKWVNVIVSVYNQIVDIYVDGQLASSCVLKGFPAISTSEVSITPDGGFSGKIARVVFMNTAMTVTDAKRIYYNGPIVSTSIFSLIPTWVYWSIILIVFVAIIYSFIQ